MTPDPLPLAPFEVLPPMEPRRPREPAPTTTTPKRNPGRRGGAVRRRFALLNWFVDSVLAELGPVDSTIWFVLYRDARIDGTATAAVSDLSRRSGFCEAAVRRALRRLRDRGLVRRLKRGSLSGGPSVYRLIRGDGATP